VSVGTNINVTAGGAISVPAATTSSQGAVQIGTNIDVSSGTISVPAATTTSQGAVQVGTNLSVASGTISVPAATTTSQGAVQVGTNIDVTSGTISVPAATSAAQGAVQVGTNIQVSSGTISVLNASTTQAGVVQLNDTTTSTSTTLALTAAQGKNLQDQITALSVSSNITLGGTYNANTGLVDSVTAQGTTAGLVVGNALPTPGPTNTEIFVIVDVQGTNGPNSPTLAHVGDWYLSDGTTWQFLNVGFAPGQATTTSQGVVQLATDAEVQAGIDSSDAVVSSSLQSKLSDSTSTTSSTTIASSTAVKAAYDLAAAAIPCSTLTAKGSLVAASAANTPANLGVGTNGQILYACSTTATGLCWAAPPAATSPATPATRGIVYGCTTDAHPVSGSGDVALGLNAYAAVTTGYSNTAIGGDALSGLTSGCNNIGIGDQAGFAITTESDNVIIGANSVLNYAPSMTVVVGSGVDFVFGNTENVIVGHSAASNGGIGTAISCSVILGACALTSANHVGDNLIAIGHCIALPSSNGNTQLAIGNGATYWLSGNSNYAIKPGAGIIDCANSCGTAGQVLMSTGTNKICWGTAGGGGSGTVTSITAGTGLTGGTITNSGTIALNTACVIQPTILTAKGDLISASAASTPTALGVGTNGQVLTACSTCTTGLTWATPPSVYQTTSSSSYSFTTGVPVNLLNFGDSNSVIDMTLFTNPQGTVSVVWKAVKAGDPTNYNTGWNPYFSWPAPSVYDPGSLVMISPVYPDPLAGNMILYYTPAASFTSAFTLVYSAMLGAAPTWMI
jgi:hypothetical protein